MDIGGLTLGTGTTSAAFQIGGREALNMAAKGSLINEAKSFNNQFGSPLGPGALWTLIRDNRRSI